MTGQPDTMCAILESKLLDVGLGIKQGQTPNAGAHRPRSLSLLLFDHLLFPREPMPEESGNYPCQCNMADDVCPYRGPLGKPQCEEYANPLYEKSI